MMDGVSVPRLPVGEPLANQPARAPASVGPCLAGQPHGQQPRRRHCPRRLPTGSVQLTRAARPPCPDASLLDVSETGAGLAMGVALEPGHEVELALWGRGHLRPVRLAADVVWSASTADGRYRIGVKFRRRLSG